MHYQMMDLCIGNGGFFIENIDNGAARSDRMLTPPRTGIIQVNLDDQVSSYFEKQTKTIPLKMMFSSLEK